MDIRMNSKFFDLKKEKQDRMINAALKVFAIHGYRHAGTDEMVREAGISKGLLFHYFGNKMGLYSFVYDYSVRYIMLELRATVNPKQRDLFEVLRQIEAARMHAMRNYPYMQKFLNRSMTENVGEVLLEIENRRNTLLEAYQVVEAQIDYAALPVGVDGQKLRKMLDFTIKGLLEERFQEESFQPEMLYEEISGYLDMVKFIVNQNKEE